MSVTDSISLHNQGDIDLLDYFGAPAFGLCAVVLTGIGTFSIFNTSLSETVFSATGVNVSIAFLVAAFLLIAAWFTNRAGDGWEDLDEFESVSVGGGVIVLVGVAFVPFISDLVAGSHVWGVVSFVLLSGAYTVLAWY
jgi:hypothetical protein